MFQFPFRRPISLGDRPWTESAITDSLFADRNALMKALDDHPGRDIRDRLASINACLRLFAKSESALQASIAKVHDGTVTERLLDRRRKQDFRALRDEIQESLFIFCASAMTLVDQARALSQRLTIPGYDELIEATFRRNTRHRFIQELRVDLIHVTMHDPGWQFTRGKPEDATTKLLLHPSQLRRFPEYHSSAKEYVAAFSGGVDLGETAQAYRQQVENFQAWLKNAAEEVARDDLMDLQRCRKIVDGRTSRMFWGIIFQQVLIDGNRDPYAYLDRQLTTSELEEVRQLPDRSKAQVDRIIELVDDVGACDEDLRKLVYKAFKVTDV